MSTETRPTPSLTEELTDFIASHVALADEPVGADTDLVMTGLVDSLGVVRIVGWIENRMQIEIDPADVVVEHFGSVSAMLDYLRARGHAAVS